MILLAPFLIYCLFVSGIFFTVKKRFRRAVILTAIIFLPVCGFIYLSHLFSIALEDHYDVKKGTFLWYATMDNSTIVDFPKIEPIGKVIYNSIGGDSPNISTGWSIEYNSNQGFDDIFPVIQRYLDEEGYNIGAVTTPKCNWKDYKNSERIRLFAGVSRKGECLDLSIKIQENGTSYVEVLILY